VTSKPPETPGPLVGDEAGVMYCAGHPDVPTKLRCSRCDRPICGRCAIPATVGQHCPWCVAEARRTAPKVRSTMSASAPAVVAIVVANLAVYLAQNLVPAITQQFASFPPAIAQGEWWRLITPMFLHAPLRSTFSLLHIGFNMFVLWNYGPHVEERLGTLRFVVCYFVAGFFASAASYALGPCNVLGLGASGAIFGIVGVLLVILYNRRRSTFVRGFLQNLLFFVGLNLLLGLRLAGIDWVAHAGGLLAGIVLGAGFDRARAGATTTTVQAVTALSVVAVAVALVAWRTATFSCV
jgi:membrane associated rhomboid family serine protease